MQALEARIPHSPEVLFKEQVHWDGLPLFLENKIKPVIEKMMALYLGDVAGDALCNTIVGHLKARHLATTLIHTLRPIFPTKAHHIVVAIWRQLVFETEAHNRGYDSGSYMVSEESRDPE
ncbi:hypothetical protein SISSUDRAFT_994672 [Sistotremastrum suecicum HHB10207 ss-3]|uniref:PWI domain-containing protein n=1 Tax=Sistotremastrum suecicum HHB10207 ss-3 TaxID=1314776 RepID=A0A165X511_9AGAM|nr:hypothetical protein SISSUDRAFT_994672 [Sistotremastrum suecicum HHB10207 ss-3]